MCLPRPALNNIRPQPLVAANQFQVPGTEGAENRRI
jgi:hypothetical protein